MTIIEIICIVLLCFFIVLFAADITLSVCYSMRELQRDKKIDSILSAVEKAIDDDVFPEFKDDK